MNQLSLPEAVRCEAPGCRQGAVVRLPGTLPRGWLAKWYGAGDYPRVCSDACLDRLKEARR